jgi:hypothetical protein
MEHSFEARSCNLPYWETPPYTVIQTFENGVEERHYPPRKWAVHEEVLGIGQFIKREYDLFWPIFSFVTGRNSTGQKIPLTIPTSTRVEQIDTQKFKYQTGYYLPEEFQLNPPIPLDNNVQIVTRELHVYALVFPGYAKEKDFSIKASELVEFLQNNDASIAKKPLPKNIAVVQRLPHHVHYNVVNCPAKCWGKRNEVWVPAEHYARLWDRSNSDPTVLSLRALRKLSNNQ